MRRPLVGLLTANAVSITGNMLTVAAVPWFVLETTGSPGKAGIVYGVSSLPIMLSAAFSGTFADRIGHRRASIVSDLGSASIVMLVPLLHAAGRLAFWQILAIVFLRSLLATPGETARGALLPALAEGGSLERSTSAYDAVARGARMIGFPLAGVLIGAIGAPNLLFLDAATFCLSALIVARFVPAPPKVARERSPFIADLRAGLAYVRDDRLVRNVVLLCMATNMLDAGMGGVLFPVHVKEVIQDPRVLGLPLGVSAGASVAGAVAFGAWGSRLPRRRTFVVAYVLCGIPRFAVLALHAPLAVIVAVFGLSGLAAGCLNPIMDTSLYERLPENMRARVFGVVFAGCTAAMPVGGLVAGLAVSRAGLTATLWAFGLAYLLVTLAPAVFRSWSGLERVKPVPASVTVAA